MGRFIARWLPLRGEVVRANLERVYGGRVDAAEIARIAAAHYGHLWRLAGEFVRFRWMSAARKKALVRVEGVENFIAARDQGRGILILTGHFGNWEVSTTAGIAQFPEMHGRFHFVRRPIKPDWLDRLVTRRFEQAGFGVFSKRDSLDALLECLARGDAVVLPFDQHAGPPDGIEVDFLGHRGVDLQEPGDHRVVDRRAGAAGVELARGRRQPCAALRAAAWRRSNTSARRRQSA